MLADIGSISNKAQRLSQIRETFRALAGGDPGTALRTAKQIADATERETALIALLTEWKQGELNPPLQRALPTSLANAIIQPLIC